MWRAECRAVQTATRTRWEVPEMRSTDILKHTFWEQNVIWNALPEGVEELSYVKVFSFLLVPVVGTPHERTYVGPKDSTSRKKPQSVRCRHLASKKVSDHESGHGNCKSYRFQCLFTNPGMDNYTLHFSHLFTWNWSFVGVAALPLQLDLYESLSLRKLTSELESLQMEHDSILAMLKTCSSRWFHLKDFNQRPDFQELYPVPRKVIWSACRPS